MENEVIANFTCSICNLLYKYNTLAPNINSGHLYQSVTTTGVYRFNGEPYSRANPKSATCTNKETF